MNPAEPLFGFAVVAGLGLLTWSANRFVSGASGLARNFGVSPMIIGLTIVAFGTSAPEMLVSAMAAWQGNSGIAIDNAVGSSLFNILAVLGIAGVIGPGGFDEAVLTRDFPLMIGLAIALYLMARGGTHRGMVVSGVGQAGCWWWCSPPIRYGFFLVPHQHAWHENPAGGDR